MIYFAHLVEIMMEFCKSTAAENSCANPRTLRVVKKILQTSQFGKTQSIVIKLLIL